jgi:GT2 family glycosyltransferase
LCGRNKAITDFEEDIIVYLDDDVHLPEGWLERIREPFANPDVHFVGCRYLPKYERPPPYWMSGLWAKQDGFNYLWYLSLLDGGSHSRFYQPSLIFGLCFAGRRETMLRLGGFHPDAYPWEMRMLRGDGETAICQKAEAMGLKAYYQAATYVLHDVPRERLTKEYFRRRSFLQGISASYADTRAAGRLNALPRFNLGRWAKMIRPGFRADLARAHDLGAREHHAAMRANEDLLAWVLREHYFGVTAPDIEV